MNFQQEGLNMKFDSLYDTINKIYQEKRPFSRVLYISKIKEFTSKDDKVTRETTLNSFKEEVKRLLRKLEGDFNYMIVYIGLMYAIIGIEVTIF
jgi:hypothetical protein